MAVDEPTIDERHRMDPCFYCPARLLMKLKGPESASRVEKGMAQTSVMEHWNWSRPQEAAGRLTHAAYTVTLSRSPGARLHCWIYRATFLQLPIAIAVSGQCWVVIAGEKLKDIPSDEPLSSPAQGFQAFRPNVSPNRLLTHVEVGRRLGYSEFIGHVHS